MAPYSMGEIALFSIEVNKMLPAMLGVPPACDDARKPGQHVMQPPMLMVVVYEDCPKLQALLD